jgi:cation transport ATPase
VVDDDNSILTNMCVSACLIFYHICIGVVYVLLIELYSPMAVVVGMGVAAKHGVLIKGGAALQKVYITQ